MLFEPDDPETRLFPRWLVFATWLAVVAISIVYIAWPRPDTPVPYELLLGCYSTPNGPDILVDRTSMTVLQEPPIKIPSSIEESKGWVFVTGRFLNHVRTAGGKILLRPGTTNGEIISVSLQGEWGASTSSFQLIDSDTLFAIQYSRSGDRCVRVEAG